MLQSCSPPSIIPPVIRVVSHVVDVYINKTLSTWAGVPHVEKRTPQFAISETDLDQMSSEVPSCSSPGGFVQEEL